MYGTNKTNGTNEEGKPQKRRKGIKEGERETRKGRNTGKESGGGIFTKSWK
jgi:hypothetical protein